jgi:hypothetical protein
MVIWAARTTEADAKAASTAEPTTRCFAIVFMYSHPLDLPLGLAAATTLIEHTACSKIVNQTSRFLE